jgi:hypothetical protein
MVSTGQERVRHPGANGDQNPDHRWPKHEKRVGQAAFGDDAQVMQYDPGSRKGRQADEGDDGKTETAMPSRALKVLG